jgi:multidrug efflux pump
VAEQEVQAAINAAGTYLPKPICPIPPIYSKTNPADAPIMTLALTSKTRCRLSKVEDLADTRLAQKISQLAGVGLVSISGGQKPAVRIQANPTALSAYGINLEDVRTRSRRPTSTRPREVSTARNRRTPSAPTISFSPAPITSPLVVAYRNGAPVRLSDVAT